MDDDKVFFIFNGSRYQAVFDRSKIRMGSPIFFTLDSEHRPQFSISNSPGAQQLYVTWITKSDWAVTLESPMSPKHEDVDLLLRVLGHRLTRDEIEKAAIASLKTMRPEYAFKTKEFEKTRLSQLLRISERLELCRKLAEPNIGEALFASWAPLIEYHLLTCFDLLGQPTNWMPFHNWLTSNCKEHVHQREEALLAPSTEQVNKETNPIVLSSLALFESYNMFHGVRRSFYRFLHDILSSTAKNDLFASIRIRSCNLPPDTGDWQFGDDKDKEKYLFSLRNDYTHNAQLRQGLHPEFLSKKFSIHDGWISRDQIFDAKKWICVETHNWPNALESAVIEDFRLHFIHLHLHPLHTLPFHDSHSENGYGNDNDEMLYGIRM